MTEVATIASVRKTLSVNCSPERAFEVFTAGLSRWWPQNVGIGKTPRRTVLMEQRLGGRWLEVAEDGTETVVGTIAVWEPPRRLVVLWQINAQWQPDAAMRSEVDVTFTPDGPGATVVELVHHKFETMGAEAGASMRRDVAGGWPGFVERFAREAERESK